MRERASVIRAIEACTQALNDKGEGDALVEELKKRTKAQFSKAMKRALASKETSSSDSSSD